jgi:hypothetical protein
MAHFYTTCFNTVFADHGNLQGGAPQVISWFIMPLTVDISPINPSYWSYKPIMLSRGHLVGTMFPQNRPEAELVEFPIDQFAMKAAAH